MDFYNYFIISQLGIVLFVNAWNFHKHLVRIFNSKKSFEFQTSVFMFVLLLVWFLSVIFRKSIATFD